METIYHSKLFKIDSLPLTDIHVIDDWCPTSIWDAFLKDIKKKPRWEYNNDVTYEDGETTEVTWAYRFYGKWFKQYGSQYKIVDPIIEKMCEDFGVAYQQFDYAGINGQTEGMQGTIHKDSFRPNNISFLWHCNKEWDSEWEGKFRVYKFDTLEKGVRGYSKELINKYQIAEIEYKPNRLIILDGRYPHSADAPLDCNFNLRQTLVVRGNVAEVVDKTRK